MTIGPRIITVTTGSTNERLIEIPIVAAGEFNPYTSIRITIGLDPKIGYDQDPYFGITDGSYVNEFYILDSYPYPCYPYSGSHDTIASTDSRTPGVFTFMFTPFYRYGICSVTKDGGYTVAATFSSQLDINKDLSFRLRRSTSSEQYRLYYILIETFE